MFTGPRWGSFEVIESVRARVCCLWGHPWRYTPDTAVQPVYAATGCHPGKSTVPATSAVAMANRQPPYTRRRRSVNGEQAKHADAHNGQERDIHRAPPSAAAR
jgi:hypothetical protein